MVIASGVSGISGCCLRLQPQRPMLRRRFCGVAAHSVSSNGSGSKKKTKNSGKEKVIVISGPTGAGKSRLALELAKRLNGEIISADSVQVYRGLDIGSAKPSPSERKEVPHHLIDILHPSEDYSVGQFFEDARQATRDIINRGHVPIVTGGTGLYLRWFMYGKPDVPKSSPEVISKVHEELAHLQRADEWEAAVELVVKAGDPKARFLASNDWYRLRRSLEIIKSSGSPPSAFQVPYDSFREKIDSVDSSGSPDIDSSANVSNQVPRMDLDYEFRCFFLSSPRVDLYRCIDFRCEDMVSGSEGVLTEAGWLLDIGLLPNTSSATRAIGYRQAMEYLIRCRQQGGSSSPREFYGFLSEFQKVSRNFAKRQMTWFRNEPFYHWVNASKPLEIILQFVCDAYKNQDETWVMPESLQMSKDIRNRREASELKAYHPKNRYFVRREDCSEVLEWIRRTQGCRSELVASI